MAVATFNKLVAFEVTDCCVCGVLFGLPQDFYRNARRDGSWFYCPSGHKQHFAQSEADKLREELERKERSLNYAREARDLYQQQRDAERRSHSATKGQLTKTRKRVGNGVCPCCNRTFANVARHMTSKHPSYKADA